MFALSCMCMFICMGVDVCNVFTCVELKVDSKYHSSSAVYFLLEGVPLVGLEFVKENVLLCKETHRST